MDLDVPKCSPMPRIFTNSTPLPRGLQETSEKQHNKQLALQPSRAIALLRSFSRRGAGYAQQPTWTRKTRLLRNSTD
eukprot:4456565-Pyramimonas_sp.AAC.1